MSHPHFCHMSTIEFKKVMEMVQKKAFFQSLLFFSLFPNVAPPLLPYVHNLIHSSRVRIASGAPLRDALCAARHDRTAA